MTTAVAHDGAIRTGGRPRASPILHVIRTVCPILGARLALLVLVAFVASDSAMQGVRAGTWSLIASASSQAHGKLPAADVTPLTTVGEASTPSTPSSISAADSLLPGTT